MIKKVWEKKRPVNADIWDPGVTVKYEGTKEEIQAECDRIMNETIAKLKELNPEHHFG